MGFCRPPPKSAHIGLGDGNMKEIWEADKGSNLLMERTFLEGCGNGGNSCVKDKKGLLDPKQQEAEGKGCRNGTRNQPLQKEEKRGSGI